jgi:NAD(P)H-nitrite reductase large subunit
MRYVIVGNSYAAVFAIESIRKIDSVGEIYVISKEPYHVYARAAIHEYIYGKIGDEQMYYRDMDFYKKNNLTPVLQKEVVSIETKNNKVYLNDKTSISYDKLLLSSGGIPVVPPIKGTNGIKGIFTFTTWDDAKKIMEWVPGLKEPKAVVLGGGLIGLQCAEGLKHMGVDVTVVELADYVLVKALDRKAGVMVENRLRENGIRVITGDTVASVRSTKGRVSGVVLKSGEKIPCNIFMISIGVKPNTKFLEGSGIKINRGIVVDDCMRTNIENVFAAGDVSEAVERISGKYEVIPIIPAATLQGKVAGTNMAGGKRKYPGTLSQNTFQFFHTPVISIGNIVTADSGNGFEVLEREEGTLYKKAVLKDGKLIYVLSVNSIERIGIFNTLIRERIDVSGFRDKLLADNFGFLDIPKSLRMELLTKPG